MGADTHTPPHTCSLYHHRPSLSRASPGYLSSSASTTAPISYFLSSLPLSLSFSFASFLCTTRKKQSRHGMKKMHFKHSFENIKYILCYFHYEILCILRTQIKKVKAICFKSNNKRLTPRCAMCCTLASPEFIDLLCVLSSCLCFIYHLMLMFIHFRSSTISSACMRVSKLTPVGLLARCICPRRPHPIFPDKHLP